ncbi:MAG: hypothetical protein IJC40_05180 [Muribaculaceae bacterium]|nr:hypothetical protein [Muribaculaceae bacterium]
MKYILYGIISALLRFFGLDPDFRDFWETIGYILIAIAIIAIGIFILWHFIKYMIELWSILIKISKKGK